MDFLLFSARNQHITIVESEFSADIIDDVKVGPI